MPPTRKASALVSLLHLAAAKVSVAADSDSLGLSEVDSEPDGLSSAFESSLEPQAARVRVRAAVPARTLTQEVVLDRFTL